MISKNNYTDNIFCRELGIEINAFLKKEKMDLIQQYSTIKGQVMQGMEYRPDKIAAYYLGNERLGWMIDIANGFEDGIKSYYLGRSLKIPDLNSLMSVL